jgi:predicted ATPase
MEAKYVPTSLPIAMEGRKRRIPLQRNSPDGVFFAPLQPASDSRLLVPSIASALGMLLMGEGEPRQQLLDYLSARNTLLLLDNFEQLMDGVDLLVDMLKAAPGVKLLVTSREALNVQDEWLYPVSGLSFPEDEQVDGV